MIDIRGGILSVTIAILIFLCVERPKPVKDNQTPYCVVSVYQGVKDQFGRLHTAWAPMYRPCSEQDIYRNI